MIIEEQDFRLTSDGSPFWDLELLCTIKPRNGEPRLEFKTYGYGLSLEHAIKRIINHRISQKHPDVMSLKEYLSEYVNQMNKLSKLCENL